MKKLTGSKIVDIFTAIGTAIALILLALGYATSDEGPTAKGTTNFTDLAVDSITVDGNSPVVGDTSLAIYGARVEVTGTLAIPAATHGLSAITSAVCTLVDDGPSTGAGEAALCWIGTSGTTVTITAEQDDWTTNATVMTPIDVIIIGTP